MGVGQKQCSLKEPKPLPPQSRKLLSPVALFYTSALWIQHLSPTVWLIYSTCLPQTCKGSWDNEFLRELETFPRYGKYDQKYLSGISLTVQWKPWLPLGWRSSSHPFSPWLLYSFLRQSHIRQITILQTYFVTVDFWVLCVFPFLETMLIFLTCQTPPHSPRSSVN